MTTFIPEPTVEKLPTGAIVIISGEYVPVDKNDQPKEDSMFLLFGEHTPEIAGDEKAETDWKLLEAYDFAS